MSADTSVSRWLVIVRRDKPGLYRDLARTFKKIPQVAVLLDRRVGPEAPEGGAEGRRSPLTVAELELWETVGFRLIPPAVLMFHDAAPGRR